VTRLEGDLEHHLTAANVGAYIPLTGGGKSKAGAWGGGSGEGLRASSSTPALERGGTVGAVGGASGGPGAPDAALLQLLAEDEPARVSGGEGTSSGGRGGGSTTASGQQQMISILQAQRDRYKERLDNVSLKSSSQHSWERHIVLCIYHNIFV
jgi:hypothetical protein